MARRRTVNFLACLATGSLLLTGCSGAGSAPSAAPSPNASPTTKPALPPLGPPDLPMPEAARHHDAAGAEAFLRYYVALYNQAKDKLAPGYLREFSQSCGTCEMLVRQIQETSGDGQVYAGGNNRIEGLGPPLVRNEKAELAFKLVEEPLVILKNGAPVAGQTYPLREGPSSGAVLIWDERLQIWKIAQLDVG